MKDILKVKNMTDTSADLYIYGDIVSSEWDRWQLEDVAPEGVKSFLDTVQGKDLNIYINSGGGSVFAGLAIYNMIKRHQGTKTVHVDGLAGSIASIIAMAGDKLVIPKNAFLMIHKPWAGMQGNANDFRKMANDLDRIEQGLLAIYEENLKDGVSMDIIKTMVTKETWLSGADAATYFNIEVGESLQAVACVSDYFQNYTELPESIVQETEPSQPGKLIANITVDAEELAQKVIEKVKAEVKEEKTQEIENLLLQINLI